MKISDIILESLSNIVFHYTNTKVAAEILSKGEFQLSASTGSIEQQYAPKGYPYFLSTTRTRHGGYHDIIGKIATLFVLDGNWFNSRYPSKPIDYWENRDPIKAYGRRHEAEDRVFSKTPLIPIDGVKEIHVYCAPNADPVAKSWTRQSLLSAKRRNIKYYFYTDPEAWRNFDKRKLGDVSILKGEIDYPGTYISRRRPKGYLIPWLELMQAKTQEQLSKQAKDLKYSLQYDYDKKHAISGLKNDVSNARKPSSGPDRNNVVKIIKFMQQNNLTDIKDFVEYLANKWKSQ